VTTFVLLVIQDETVRTLHPGGLRPEHVNTIRRVIHEHVIDDHARRHTAALPAYEVTGNIPKTEAPLMTQQEMARMAGKTGNVCTGCGGFNLVRTGSCETCQDCGHNAGCG
jgi:hypothetical protein